MDDGSFCGLNFIDLLSLLSFQIGLQNLALNKKQTDDLMDEMKDGQNSMLKKIIEQNEEIISLLKENKNAN